jgi:hypothetical protein
MTRRYTWFWLVLAAGLFAVIWFHRRAQQQPHPGPPGLLSDLNPAAVTAIQLRPGGRVQLEEIRVVRTNNTWQMLQPLLYPAQATNIEALLHSLQRLKTSTYIPERLIRSRPNGDEEFGFAPPEASSITLLQGADRIHLLVGARTAPGDQVYLQRVGAEGAYVVDVTNFLQHIPHSANDWRDTTLLDPGLSACDHIAVTNHGKTFVLDRDGTNRLWRMSVPWQTRADNARIQASVQQLESLRISQFVSDDPKADLDAFGLAPPEFELALARETNAPILLQFGKSPTNAPGCLFARRAGRDTIFIVATNRVAAWRAASANDFRDPHLLTLTESVRRLEVRGQETFALECQTNESWRILPQDFPADPSLVRELLSTLTNLHIIQFVKDIVNPSELPEFGLNAPTLHYVLKAGCATNAEAGAVLAEVDFGFGTNHYDRVYARRADEGSGSVYAITTNDFASLPCAGWQLRDRKLWNLSVNDIDRVLIEQGGKARQVVRAGAHRWSLAAGSQGIINDLAIEETVRGLTEASAMAWAGCGETNRARFGFAGDGYKLTLVLKSGDKASIEFGGGAADGEPYAGIHLDGQFRVFEFPSLLYRDLVTYLSAL